MDPYEQERHDHDIKAYGAPEGYREPWSDNPTEDGVEIRYEDRRYGDRMYTGCQQIAENQDPQIHQLAECLESAVRLSESINNLIAENRSMRRQLEQSVASVIPSSDF